MIPGEVAAFLRFPFYKLYYIEHMSSFTGLGEGELEAIRREYSNEALEGIVHALEWVVANPGADLTEVLPGLPHSNSDIHTYSAFVWRALRGSK